MRKGYIFLSAVLAIILASCASIPEQRKDDAVRLNLDSIQYLSQESQPEKGKINPLIEPNTGRSRNPNVLRGTVKTVYIDNTRYIDSLGNEGIAKSKYYVFLDSMAYNIDDPQYEYIPIGLVDNVGSKIGKPDTTYWVETYNNPLDPPSIRQLPIEERDLDDCACGDFSISIPPCDGCKVPDFTCPFPWEERAQNRSWYFAEVKGIYGFYTNRRVNEETGSIEEYQTDAGSGDIAFGYRFGDQSEAHFGLGLLFSGGMPLFAPESSNNLFRPHAMIYGRYQFDELWCMFPYLYAGFGLTIDEASLYLGRVSYDVDIDGWLGIEFCDCEEDGSIDGRLELAQRAAAESPDIDLSLPISWGIGGGFDIPVHKYFDLSFDIGYRYVSYGDEVRLYGYSVPTRVGNGMFLLRGGFTF